MFRRQRPKVIWNGSRAVVWGGRCGCSDLPRNHQGFVSAPHKMDRSGAAAIVRVAIADLRPEDVVSWRSSNSRVVEITDFGTIDGQLHAKFRPGRSGLGVVTLRHAGRVETLISIPVTVQAGSKTL